MNSVARATAPAIRPGRRYDPGRRDRLIEVTLDVIAEHGVAGTTHRRIAAAADVPLGSLTYHFASLDQIVFLALGRHASRMSDLFAERLRGTRTAAELVDAVADVISTDLTGTRDLVLAYELYLAAARDPALRKITQTWMNASRELLEQHLDPMTARGLDALIEGMVLHNALDAWPMDEQQVRTVLARVVAAPARPAASKPLADRRAT